jgi:hypothetical protein
LFTREAVTLVHECSRGIPRTINVMCDNALVTGLALNRKPVDREMVLEVSRDFALRRDIEDVGDEPVLTQAVLDAPRPPEVAAQGTQEQEEPREMFRPAQKTTRFPLFGFGRR